MTGIELTFALLGVSTVGSALLVVTTRQLVHAALWLVVTLGSIAGCYLLLSAEFVAWVQVLIYVGAVVVLLLFGLMLTRAPIGRSPELNASGRQRAVAAVTAVAMATLLLVSLVDAFADERIRLGGARVAGSSEQAGEAIFRSWVLPFEALSVLLLAALIGAIVLSRRDIGASPDQRVAPDREAAQQPSDPPAVG